MGDTVTEADLLVEDFKKSDYGVAASSSGLPYRCGWCGRGFFWHFRAERHMNRICEAKQNAIRTLKLCLGMRRHIARRRAQQPSEPSPSNP